MYVADRHKKEFDYPIHQHEIFELNFVMGGAGCRRVVGDSDEIIGDLDLVLITSPDLEHVWEQNGAQTDLSDAGKGKARAGLPLRGYHDGQSPSA